jgi:hypothetical protein
MLPALHHQDWRIQGSALHARNSKNSLRLWVADQSVDRSEIGLTHKRRLLAPFHHHQWTKALNY